jgi:hypothetical protein
MLAIETDRQQEEQLRSIAEALGVGIVVVDSVEGASEVIGQQIPDLVLTPALLSLRDDYALSQRLRALGGAGAHVQTLTIPVLEPAEPATGTGGILSRLKRSKPSKAKKASSTDACTTDGFAEQVKTYLDRAAAARRHAPAEVLTPPEMPVEMVVDPDSPVVVPDPPVIDIDRWRTFNTDDRRFAALLERLDEIAQS